MWKKEDAKQQEVSPSLATPTASRSLSGGTPSIAAAAFAPIPAPTLPVSPRAAACISQGIKIKGEVTGSEDLFVDGVVDGKLSLANGSLTIGPNGHVKAEVRAREVIVRGKVEGKVLGRDKVQLWSTGRIAGDVQTESLSIEEGALLLGKVETGKQLVKSSDTKAATSAGLNQPAEPGPFDSGTAAN